MSFIVLDQCKVNCVLNFKANAKSVNPKAVFMFTICTRVQICTREQIYTRVQICTPLCRVHMLINCVHTHVDLIRNLTQGTHFYEKFAVFECSN